MNLRSRLLALMGVFSILATILIGVASYKLIEQNVIEEARQKGKMIFNYIMASRKYFKEQQRPLILELVEQNRFYPELMSGFVISRGVWDEFKDNAGGILFKQATLDPLHHENLADAQEQGLIETFRRNSDLTHLEGVITKGNTTYYYMARPVRVESKGCLRCHGDPNTAPKDQIEIYGTETGYHWKMGDTVSAYLVYVSISQALQQAKRSAGILFLVSLGAFFGVLLAIGYFIDRRIIEPVQYLSERAEEISAGKFLDEKVDYERNDEIGVLARSLEHLRQNLLKKPEIHS